jgi:hypothetical protein
MRLLTGTRRGEQWWLGLILAGYLVLAAAYSTINPLFESPDEIHHFAYVEYLLRQRQLPVAELGGAINEFHQPPLYYGLAAAFAAPTWWADSSPQRRLEPEQRIDPNPFWAFRIGQVGVDNKNQYLHRPEEALPYQGWALRVHWVRLLSIILQSLTIVATYKIGREIFPARPALYLGSLAFVAFLPQFLFIASSVSNDNLIIPLTALLIWLWIRGLRTGLTATWTLAVGVLSGLAVLTKMSGLSLIPFSLAVALLIGWRRQTVRKAALASAAIIAIALALASPVLLRNLALYGEPTALDRMSAIWGRHDPPLAFDVALGEAPNIWTSFWARFGYGQIPIPNVFYIALAAIAIVAAAGLIMGYIRFRPTPADRRFWQILVLIAVGAMFVFLVFSYVRVSLTGSNGRFVFPALPSYATLLFLGLSLWTPPSRHGTLAAAVHASMISFALAALALWLHPAYAAPATSTEPPAPTHPVYLRFGDSVELVGYDIDRDALSAGEDVNVTLYWHALTPLADDYVIFVHLLDHDLAIWGARDTHPGLGRLPTSQWQAGQYLADTIPVPIDPEAAGIAPAELRIEVGLYDLATMERLPIADAEGRPVAIPIIGRLKLASAVTTANEPPIVDHQRFGDAILLKGYNVPVNAQAGQPLPIDLYWQALAAPGRDYSVFIHLLDDEGNLVAQQDSPPQQGRYPTSLWAESEHLVDRHMLILPASLASGAYRLIAGVYDPTNGVRLPVMSEAGQVIGDHVDLPTVHIAGSDG